jgi:hypothetical protein
MTRARAHGVVEHDHRKSRDELSFSAEVMHFRNAFIEWAAF